MLPEFSLFGYQIYSYPLIMGILWAVSYEYTRSLNKVIKSFNVFFLGLFICSWVFAKLLFWITLDASLSENLLAKTNFWVGGGFVFYGGLAGGLLWTLIYTKNRKIEAKKIEFLVLPLVLGHALGRVACFLAGCCYGAYCDLPWRVHLHGADRHPVQLYESIALLALFFWLRKRFVLSKNIILPYLGSYFAIRFLIEFFRGDDIRGVFYFNLSTSQYISLLGLAFILVYMMRQRRLN